MNRLCCTENSRSPAAMLAAEEYADIRTDKVLEIRRQLTDGTYSIADRLDVVAERIFEDLR